MNLVVDFINDININVILIIIITSIGFAVVESILVLIMTIGVVVDGVAGRRTRLRTNFRRQSGCRWRLLTADAAGMSRWLLAVSC